MVYPIGPWTVPAAFLGRAPLRDENKTKKRTKNSNLRDFRIKKRPVVETGSGSWRTTQHLQLDTTATTTGHNSRSTWTQQQVDLHGQVGGARKRVAWVKRLCTRKDGRMEGADDVGGFVLALVGTIIHPSFQRDGACMEPRWQAVQ